jgi:hypothetical protein
MPAMTLPSVDCAARPAITDNSPALASTLARGLDAREGQEDGADADDDEHRDRQPADDEHLRADASGHPVVRHVDAVAVQAEALEEDRELAREPAADADRDHEERVRHLVAPWVQVLVPRDGRRERHPDQDDEQRGPGRVFRPAGQGRGPAFPAPERPEHEVQHEGRDGGDEQGEPDRDEESEEDVHPSMQAAGVGRVPSRRTGAGDVRCRRGGRTAVACRA